MNTHFSCSVRKFYENTKEWRAGKLGAKWEGPYKITKVVKPGVYELESKLCRVLGIQQA